MNKQEYTGLEIAVIGMACKFPGASNVNEYWENIKNGKESISRFSDDELREYGIQEKEFSNPNYIKAKGLIKDAELFDASFFGIPLTEANVLDPQFRILLQCAYNALEDAGYDFAERNNTGVFVGGAPNFNWQMECFKKIGNLHSEEFASLIANDKDFISTRLSYLLNLQGHSQTIYTACSTSLVAIDMACQSLLTGKCDVTLAGGVSLSLPYKSGYKKEEGMIMSKDGHTRSFDADATGTIWSDGVGTVVLKRLEDALADGDNIHAIIKGSATNNDGDRKVGFTAPSIHGQISVINKAIEMAEIPRESISYIEGHGSATALGDKIEINALIDVFKGVNKDFSCLLGSVKSNIGHLNVASGIAGFIKVCLMFKHTTIPPSINFKTPNSQLTESNNTFLIPDTLVKWENSNFPLRAGVSSFGIGGTNAHIILEKAPGSNETKEDEKHSIICLSANTPSDLNNLSKNLSDFVNNNKDINVSDLAYTLQVGRKHLKYRKAFVVKDSTELIKELEKEQEIHKAKEFSDTVFMFPGMGGFYPKIGFDLYQKESVFRNTMDKCFLIIKSRTGVDFKSMMYGDNTLISQDFQAPQLMIFSFEYSLAILLKSWGIVSNTTIGYSLGEYVGACVEGVFSLEDALEILIERGRLINTLDTGGMSAIPLSRKEVEPYLEEGVFIAIDNGESVAVAGRKNALNTLADKLKKKNVLALEILDKYAVHTSEMNPITEEFKNILSEYSISSPATPMVSNVTGDLCSEEYISPEYWIKHLAEPIDFSKVIKTLLNKKSNAIYIEVGVGKFIGGLLSNSMGSQDSLRYISLSRSENHIKKYGNQVSDHTYLLKALATLWEYGGRINWKTFNGNQKRNKLSLPTYPFKGTAYSLKTDNSFLKTSNDLVRQEDMSSWFYVPSWKKKPIVLDNDQLQQNNRNILLLDFSDCEEIYDVLQKNKHNVIRVNYGDKYKKVTKNSYILNYNKKEDVLRLFQSLEKENMILDSILDLTSISDEEENMNLERIVTIIQSINKTEYTNKKLEYFAVSNNLFKIYGNEEINPAKSGIISATKIIPQENPNINCRLIEIEKNSCKTKNGSFYKFIIDELNARDGIVSYRGKYRWTQIYEPYPIHNPETNNSHIKDKGTYIIIGGLGDVGFTIAQYILESFESNVVIVGRSEIPEKTERKKWIKKHGTNDAISKKIARINQLENKKGNVFVMQGDSTSYDQMESVVEEVRSKFGDINGIFHSAGDVSAMSLNLINSTDKEDLNSHISSKIKGLSVLQKIVKNNTLDFTVIVSSTSSILGGIGMIGYAASNQYVDSLVAKENNGESFTKWMSLNYTYLNKEKGTSQEDIDGIQNTDQEEGRKVFEKLFSKNNDTANTSIDFDESKKVFQRLLSKNNNEDQVIVSPINFPALVEKLKNTTREIEEGDNLHSDSKRIRPVMDVPYVAPRNDLERKLAEIWEAVFGFEVSIEDDFFQLGGDSLGMIQLISNIQEVFGIQLDIRKLFTAIDFKDQIKLIKDSLGNSIEKIKPAPIREHYPLFGTQKRLFSLYQMDPESISYNTPSIFEIKGNLNVELCENVLKKIIKRHEILRTSFHVLNEEPIQKIHDDIDFNIEYIENAEGTDKELLEKFVKPFNLSNPPLIRVWICKENNIPKKLIMDIHHIVTDASSFEVLIKEFLILYREETIEPLTIQYRDFVEWEEEKREDKQRNVEKEFWLQEYETVPDKLNIPFRSLTSNDKKSCGNSVSFQINEEKAEELIKFGKQQKVTMSTLTLSVFYVLLSKLSNQEDIVIGTSTIGRWHPDLKNLIGLFINTLPLRSYPKGNIKFSEFLDTVKDHVLACLANEEYSFDQLLKELKLIHNLNNNQLFDVTFEYHKFNWTGIELSDASLSKIELPNLFSRFDLVLRVDEKVNHFEFNLDYPTGLFSKETVELFASYYLRIIDEILKGDDVYIKDIQVLSKNDTIQLINEFNDTALPYEEDKTVLDIFSEQVLLRPQDTALVFNQEKLSYKELDTQSTIWATHLIEENVQPGDVVALMMDRSMDVVIAMFSIMKAGATYLPIDVNLPINRIEYMLKECNAKTILTNMKGVPVPLVSYTWMNVLEFQNLKKDMCKITLPKSTSKDLMYIIFTSGSTGKPKGVMISQGSVVNLVKGLNERVYRSYGNQSLRVALLASHSFDASVQQIFGALLQGHSLYISDNETRKDGNKLLSFYNNNSIDLSDGTPTHLRFFLEALNNGAKLNTLSSWILAGEVLPKDLVKLFYSKLGQDTQLYNFYGPTEACVDSTGYKIDIEQLELYDHVPIGKPLPNERIYITDQYGKIVPKGIIGELCIAGDGLAKGYVGDPLLTSKKFDSEWISGEERVYRTGDMAKWLPDGNIEYYGRNDDHVKIRGFRIHLAEIEEALNSLPEIQQAVVKVNEASSGDKQLVGYIISRENMDSKKIQQILETELPEYMIPRIYVQLQTFPVTSNGKVDKKLLKIPDANDNYVAPTNELQKQLAILWQEVLGIEQVGIYDNFYELGGDSIKAIQLASRSKASGIHFQVKDIFKHQTVSEIIKHLKNIDTAVYELGVLEGEVPMHPIQKHFFERGYEDISHYNQTIMLKMSKSVTKETLNFAISELIKQHDALRMCYKTDDSKKHPSQWYASIIPELQVEKIATMSNLSHLCTKYQADLDIFKGDLARFVLFITPEEEHENRLFIAIHHLAIDGVSSRILTEDLMSLIENHLKGNKTKLPAKGTSYRQWNKKLNTYVAENSLKKEYLYWKKILSNYTPLPVDMDYDNSITYQETKKIRVSLSSSLTHTLVHDINNVYGTEINDILISALTISLSDWVITPKVVIGLEGHGREELFKDIDINRTVGWFTSLYPICLDFEGVDDIDNLIADTKDMLRAVPNKGIGYGALRFESDSLNIKSNLSMFYEDLVFNYLGSFDNNFSTQQERIGSISLEETGHAVGRKNVNLHKIAIDCIIVDGCLYVDLNYDGKRYKDSTIQKLADAYISALENILSHNKELEESEESLFENEEFEIISL